MKDMVRFNGLEVGYDIPAVPGMFEEEIQTPCLVLDLNALERNIKKMGDYAAAHGMRHRVHGKMHKSVDVAKLQIEPLIKEFVILPAVIGAHAEEHFARALAQHFSRRIARRDAIVIGFVRDAERIEILYSLRLWHRRIGDQTDRAALVAKPDERFARLVKGISAIMDDAPNITENGIILV